LALIRQANFDSVNTLMFSPRPQTKAAALPNPVSDEVKSLRLQEMMALVENQALRKNQLLIGKTLEVLVEGPAKEGKLSGRTRGNKIVYFNGAQDLLFKIVPVKITSAKSWVLEGDTLR
jgi:tRNA-2-methylthio-N6-dimethylallyladenosine synthase